MNVMTYSQIKNRHFKNIKIYKDGIMENKLSLRYILDRILFDLVINKKDDINNINNEIIVVISPYKDIKKYLSFKLNEG